MSRLVPALIAALMAPPIAPLAIHAANAAPADRSQCLRDMAGLDRSFAGALDDLARNSTQAARCTAWRRQIDIYEQASAVIERCAPDDTRASSVGRMRGSITNFRDLIAEAKCPAP